MLTRKHIAKAERDRILRRRIMIVVVVVGVAVIGLLAVGIYQSRVVQPREPVAVVNGEPILTEEFRGRVRLIQYDLVLQYQNINSILDFIGDDADTAASYQAQLDNVAQQLANPLFVGTSMLQSLVQEKLIEQEAVRRGIQVSEQDIDRWFEEQFGFVSDPTEAVVTPTLVPDATPAPTATPFTREQYELSLQAYLTNVGRYGVDEASIRSDARARLYRQRLLDAFEQEVPREQEQVWARHILVDEQALAQELLDRIEAGEDWTELAAEYSTDSSNSDQGGDLGWFARDRMVEPFEQAAFDAEVGEVVGPVQTEFGWHLIEVLGHEVRQLDDGTYQLALSNHLDDWLAAEGEAADIEVSDFWPDRVPSPPVVSQG